MKKIFAIFGVIITLIQCNNNSSSHYKHSNANRDVKENMHIINGFTERFQITNDTTTLDSLIIHMDEMKSMVDKKDFVLKKAWALSILGKYKQGILFLKEVNDSLLNSIGPNYKEIAILRLKAIQSLKEGNKEKADQYIEQSLTYLSHYLEGHQTDIRDYILSANTTDAFNGSEFVTLVQYYCYYSYIYGVNKALEKVDQLSLDYPQSELLVEYLKMMIEAFDITSFAIV